MVSGITNMRRPNQRKKGLKQLTQDNRKYDLNERYYPGLKFALSLGMITPEEHKAILAGDMCIEGPYLTNLNAATVSNPTGTRVKLYAERGIEIMSRRLMGLDDGDTWTT